jgi:predicted component of type VI protein secretion system
MPYKKGKSGNLAGRPKGAQNKVSAQLRETISDFLEDNFSKVISDFEELTPKDRVKFYCDLLQYGLPRLQAVQVESEFDRLPDDQLEAIIANLKSKVA